MVAFGQMPLRDVGRELQKFEAEAIKILKETGADHVLYGVKDYDKYLTTIFGNYMTPPPVEQRVVHHNIVCCDLNLPIAEYLKRIGK